MGMVCGGVSTCVGRVGRCGCGWVWFMGMVCGGMGVGECGLWAWCVEVCCGGVGVGECM